MKKYYYASAITALVFSVGFTTIVLAQPNDNTSNRGEAEFLNNSSVHPPATPWQGSTTPTVREKLRAVSNAGITNVKNNEDARNTMLDSRRGMASTTFASTTGGIPPHFANASSTIPRLGDNRGFRPMPMPPFRTDLFKRFASSTAFASSTLMQRLEDERGKVKELRLDLFAWRQNNLVDQLTKAMNNLAQIRTRINTRIQNIATSTATSTRDMTEAKALLAIADSKIAAANTAIQALASYVPPTTASTTATTTVDIVKPRKIGNDAIKAVNDAKKSLNDVIVAIARSMGLKLGQDKDREHATSTASTTTQ